MHYPKQQQCCIDILDYMEKNGINFQNLDLLKYAINWID